MEKQNKLLKEKNATMYTQLTSIRKDYDSKEAELEKTL